MMTRERLEAYREGRRALGRLERLARRPVGDKVRGSLAEFPYTEVSIPVVGLDAGRVRRYREKKAQLEAERAEIAGFLAGMEDLYVAELIGKRYLSGESWRRIWEAQGCVGTPDGPRKIVARYLEKAGAREGGTVGASEAR